MSVRDLTPVELERLAWTDTKRRLCEALMPADYCLCIDLGWCGPRGVTFAPASVYESDAWRAVAAQEHGL